MGFLKVFLLMLFLIGAIIVIRSIIIKIII